MFVYIQGKHVHIPLRDFVPTFYGLFLRECTGFLDSFNGMSLDSQLDLMGADSELKGVLSPEQTKVVPGVSAVFGITTTQERECELTSGSSMTSRHNYFVVGDRGIHFQADQDGSQLRVRPVVDQKDGVHVHRHKHHGWAGFTHYEVRDWPISLNYGAPFAGDCDVRTGELSRQEFQANIAGLRTLPSLDETAEVAFGKLEKHLNK